MAVACKHVCLLLVAFERMYFSHENPGLGHVYLFAFHAAPVIASCLHDLLSLKLQ